MSVNRLPTLALSELSQTPSNQCSLSYPVLKHNETQYILRRQLIQRICRVLLFEHIDEDEVFAKRAAQMADSSLTLYPSITNEH
ncbi:hypothetical protein CY34DRAFT_812154 [Suillus luteus UH-Slu-Lm8-n1]|uniref:Uncharacterized protein n=1 Tax=Suillus luteus UH-Slu-Lm8-n1 TaxID=930992 RepID=A0A0D0A0X0_9AGAM|nr:hypothetical protein CY34DRAFT_812154 [Suillus luteus UH-Slu-Lm8-n1]